MSSTHSPSISRDKKILRRLNYSMARYSVLSVLSGLMVFGLLLTTGDFYKDSKGLASFFITAVVAVSGFRLYLVLRFDQLHGAAPNRWRNMFALGILSQAVLWGLLLNTILFFYGIDDNIYIVGFYVLIMGAATCCSWMVNRIVIKAYLLITIPPIAIGLLAIDNTLSPLVSVLISFYGVFLWFFHREHYRNFWYLSRANKNKVNGMELESKRVNDESEINLKQDAVVKKIAREVRTPMSNIMGMLSLINDVGLSKEQQQYHDVASRSGELLLSFVEHLTDYVNVLNGKVSIDSNNFNVRRCFEQAMDLLFPVAYESGIELSCVYDKYLPARVRGDKDRLTQVFMTLVNNAIKYSEGGEITVQVSFKQTLDMEGMLRVNVNDQGKGMSIEEQENLFTSPVIDSCEDDSKQAGIGLLVCSGVIEAMGGELGVFSQEGEGSTFWFTTQLRLASQRMVKPKFYAEVAHKKALVVTNKVGVNNSLLSEFDALDMQVESINSFDQAVQVLRSSARVAYDYDFIVIDDCGDCQRSLNLSKTLAADPKLNTIKQLMLLPLSKRGDKNIIQHEMKHPQIRVISKPLNKEKINFVFEDLLLDKKPGENKPALDRAKDNADVASAKLLLVEDNKVNQIVATGMLKKLGYSVKTVNNGKEALGILADHKFDLILMDCQMPELDGYAATTIIRQREIGTEDHVPIIAMTANAMEGDDIRCFAAGMDDYLAKPVHIDNLASKLRLLLLRDDCDEGVIHVSNLK